METLLELAHRERDLECHMIQSITRNAQSENNSTVIGWTNVQKLPSESNYRNSIGVCTVMCSHFFSHFGISLFGGVVNTFQLYYWYNEIGWHFTFAHAQIA